MLRPICLAALLALGGCTLIDQRTFERTPQAPAAAAVARAALPEQALLTIRMGGGDWQPALARAVAAAEGRAPGVAFEVAALVPLGATPARADAAVRQAGADAREIAEGLEALGVPPARIHLALRGDAGEPPREVRLYTR